MEQTDVLVVGAGPVGLTLAVALRRLSMSVLVVDKASGTHREPRADVIFPRAGEALGALGVGETIRRHCYEMQGADFYGDGRHLGSFVSGRFDSQYPRAMTIEQHHIERLLADELAQLDVKVTWQTEVVDVCEDADRVEVLLQRPDGGTEMVFPRWVVACDGKQSTVRERLGIPFEGRRRANIQILQGNVVPSWPLNDRPGYGYFFLAPYRSVIAFPIPDGGYRIFCVRDDPDPDQQAPPSVEELRDVVAETAHMPDLQFTLTDPVWLNRVRVSDRVATVLRRGRILLAGDAAHAWTPVGGHGMNVGMLGAHNLAWKLAAVHRGEAGDALLDTYSVEQRALAAGVIRDMRFNITEMLLPPLPHRVRSALLRATMPRPGFQRRTEWMMSDFGRNHRKSPLSWHRSGRVGQRLRAGDRLPDVTVVPGGRWTAGGNRPIVRAADIPGPMRLHQLLRYDRWTMVVAASGADVATMRTLQEACARSPVTVEIVTIAAVATADGAQQLGRVGDLKLVRPDGSVGLVAPLDRPDLLRDYLAAVFRRPGMTAASTPQATRQQSEDAS
jgi:2-polyprenyl-6-methoxyphenol hydroxylase-like FAD-dependent oxidoreductase